LGSILDNFSNSMLRWIFGAWHICFQGLFTIVEVHNILLKAIIADNSQSNGRASW